MNIFLLRHGETDWNLAGRLQGHTDITLNENGREQIRQAAEILSGLATDMDLIIASPLSRARESAEIVADQLAYKKENVVVEPLLIERSFGRGEGLTLAERNEQYPDGNYPEMEAYEALITRARTVFEKIVSTFAEQKNILLVAHGAILHAILTAITEGRIAYGGKKVQLTPGSIHLIQYTEGEIKRRNVNFPYDLQKLSHAEYQILWHDFCDDFFQRKKKAYPTRVEAEKLLREAESCNPGPWGNHSRIAASCAEKIAALCDDMDSEKAYVVGLLHDIGRKFGVKHLGHVYDGYHYMRDLGYGDAARICLTHSFSIPDLSCYIGNRDISPEQQQEINDLLHATKFDDYDLLIQLCDALAGAEGVLDMEERMAGVKRRYGSYPQEKWERNLYLREYFEKKTGRDLYEIVR